MNPFDRLKSLGIFLGIGLILAGVVFLVYPEGVIGLLTFLVGLLLLLLGAFRGMIVVLQWQDILNRVPKLLISIILVSMGIFVLSNSRVTVTLLGVAIGIAGILLAFDRFSVAMARKERGLPYSSALLFGTIHLAFGIGMFYSAFTLISVIISIIGAYLILAGIMVILSASYFFDF